MSAKLYCRWLTVVAGLLSLTIPFGSATMASARLLSARQVDRHFEQRMEAARAARDARQPVDCFVETAAAQEIIAAYRGNIERQSIEAMSLADRCLIDAGGKEVVASTIKEKLGGGNRAIGRGQPVRAPTAAGAPPPPAVHRQAGPFLFRGFACRAAARCGRRR